jgi:hypothetical protein
MRRFGAALVLLVAVLLLTGVAVPEVPSSAPQPAPALDPELGVPLGLPLHSATTSAPPALDGRLDAAWEGARPLQVALHYGLHGDEPAGTVEMRSLHDAANVYFLLRWPSAQPGGEPDVWCNLLTVHWRLADLASGPGLACTVSCHTATADGQARLIGIRSETIPPGLAGQLLAGGGWADGTWTFEWSRPRASDNPYDQDMLDPSRDYRFFVKLFLDQEGKADPVSDVHALRLRP